MRLSAAADHLVELVDGLDLLLLRREETKAIRTHRDHGLVEWLLLWAAPRA
ncbi:MAG: hypothetical protein ACNA8O_10960 [Cyanobacteriota bacterium]|jgi:hypothetical protein